MKRRLRTAAIGLALATVAFLHTSSVLAAGSSTGLGFFDMISGGEISLSVSGGSSLVGPWDFTKPDPLGQRTGDQDTTLTLTDANAPASLYLGQNSPNPFRVGTTISYGLPTPSWVRITIHSMLGTQVRSIVNEPQKAGHYTVQFSDVDLKPGIYFYRIETDFGLLTRRMTVSR